MAYLHLLDSFLHESLSWHSVKEDTEERALCFFAVSTLSMFFIKLREEKVLPVGLLMKDRPCLFPSFIPSAFVRLLAMNGGRDTGQCPMLCC